MIVSATRTITNEIVSGTINGTNVTFTLAYTPILGTQAIYLGNGRLTPGAGYDYTISGNVITMLVAPVTGPLVADYKI